MRKYLLTLLLATGSSVVFLSEGAVTNYVTPVGAGIENGADWANAYSNLQSAVDNSSGEGSVLYLSYGTYVVPSEIRIDNHPGLTIKGGYAGIGSPGALTNTASVIRKDALPAYYRIMCSSASTVRLERISIEGGRINDVPGEKTGAGINLTNGCSFTIIDCEIRDNIAVNADGGKWGGGIYVKDGLLDVRDSLFDANKVSAGWWSDRAYGGAIASVNSDLSVSNCVFAGNTLATRGGSSFGGCIYMVNGGNAIVQDCILSNSFVYTQYDRSGSGYDCRGAALYAKDIASLVVRSCDIVMNRVRTVGYGNALYLEGAAMTSLVENCHMANNGEVRNVAGVDYTFPNIQVQSGTAVFNSNTMVNCDGAGLWQVVGSVCVVDSLFENCTLGDGIRIQAGDLSVVRTRLSLNDLNGLRMDSGAVAMTNCLVENNGGCGVLAVTGTLAGVHCTLSENGAVGLSNTAATVSLANSIVWGNVDADIVTNGVSVTYSCAYEPMQGDGNTTADPLFTDSAGRDFTLSPDSPCIDTGTNSPAAATDIVLSSRPVDGVGDGIAGYDMGCHEAADVSSANLKVRNMSVVNVTGSSATLRGLVISTGGGANPATYICWDDVDRGVLSTGAWAHVEALGVGYGAGDAFETNITGLIQLSNYTYRAYVTNSLGEDWADIPRSFWVPGLSTVTNQGAIPYRRGSWILRGEVLDTGMDVPFVWVRYWESGDTVTNVIVSGLHSGSFMERVSGLTADTTYECDAVASNDAGVSWSDIRSFETYTEPDSFYVSLDGDGSVGTNWATAISNTLDAFLLATLDGDQIYFKSGTYFLTNQIDVIDHPGLGISGQYAGIGEPGSVTDAETVWRRDVSVTYMRIFSASASTITVERIVAENGVTRDRAGEKNGAGFSLINGCDVSIRGCTFRNNTCRDADGGKMGAGLCVVGGRIDVSDSVFKGNRITAGWYYDVASGGGMAFVDADVVVTNCAMVNNFLEVRGGSSMGAGVYLSGGTAELLDCVISNNIARTQIANGAYRCRGGGIYAKDVNLLLIRSCTVVTNGIGTIGFGNGLWLGGAGLTGVVERCGFSNNVSGEGGGETVQVDAGAVLMDGCRMINNRDDGFVVEGGNVTVRSTLIAGHSRHGVVGNGGTLSVLNCTVADNGGDGIASTATNVYVTNSIAYYNSTNIATNTIEFAHGCTTPAYPGTGNISTEPGFVDHVGGDYHIPFFSPCYNRGKNDAWVYDATDLDGNPRRTGGRVDIGAYELSIAVGTRIVFQ